METSLYDEEILHLRPAFELDAAAVVAHLDGIPGAFRDPLERQMWILPSIPARSAALRAWREAHPTQFSSDSRVQLRDGREVVVVNGATTAAWACAQRLVAWLLSLGPWDLQVRGQEVGRVTKLSEIYGQDWDPDRPEDLTLAPPKSGLLTTWERGQEYIGVHESGLVAYSRGDGPTIYRRLSPAWRKLWADFVRSLPLNADQHVRDELYTDPVIISLVTPEDYLTAVKLDAAQPLPAHKELVEVLRRWAQALAADPAAVPDGLVE